MRILVLIGIFVLLVAATPSQAIVQTLSTNADGTIDQHVNYATDIILPVDKGWSDQIRVGSKGIDYTNPVPGPQEWGIMTFDTSGIASDRIVNQATLKLQQMGNYTHWVEWFDRGKLSYRTAVYGITNPGNAGAYNETSTNFSQWIGDGTLGSCGNSTWDPIDDYLADVTSTGNLTFLGYMGNEPDLGASPYNPSLSTGAECVFNDQDLIDLVQAWINGTKTNYGLMLRWADEAGLGHAGGPSGDDYYAIFASSEHSTIAGPQLVINHVPEPATLSLLVLGGLALIRRRCKK
jgi:hypothetical protein